MGFKIYGTVSLMGDQGSDREEDILFQLEDECSDYADLILNNETSGNNFDEQIKEFSKKYPEDIFFFEGENSEGTRYRTYYQNGKMQDVFARELFAKFNPKKLR